MPGRFSRSLELARASLSVVRDDKELLLFYVVASFITLFFNTALVGAAMIRMDGGNPHVGDGLRIAWQRVGRIFGYACIAGTVGLLLCVLEERVGWVGRIVVKLIGTFGLGFVFGLAYVVLTITGVSAVVLAAQAGGPSLVSLAILLALVAFFTLAALQATLQAVHSAALYRYATDHTTALPGFGPALLESAFASKP